MNRENATRSRLSALGVLLSLLLLRLSYGSAIAADPTPPTYERDIRPLLTRHCTICHNIGKKETPDVSGGLALDSFDSIQAGTGRRKVAVAGKSAKSELAKRLSDPDEDRRMPLSEDPLPEVEKTLIRRWIDAGMPRGSVSPTPKPSMAAAPSSVVPIPTVSRPIRWRKSIDVSIPLDVKLKDGEAGVPKGGPLRIVAKVGPLPPVASLAFRGDGRILAAGTYGQVVLWDVVDCRPIRTIGGLPGPIHTLAFSRDGKRLAVGTGAPARTGIVRVYGIPGGELLHEFAGHADVVFGLAFRGDGAQLASASFDQTIRVWSLVTGREEGIFRGHSDFVEAIAYTQDGRSILSAGKDRTIKRLNGQTLKEEQTYSSHDDDVLCLAVHPDGVRFVSSGNEPQLRWWTLSSVKPVKQQRGHRGPVHQLAFSRDGRWLISASADGSVRVWDGSTGSLAKTLQGTKEWLYSSAISDDGTLVAAGGWDGLIQLWNAGTGKLRGTLLQVPLSSSESTESHEPNETDWMALSVAGYLAGSSPMLDIVRAQVGEATIPEKIVRTSLVNTEQTAKAMAGDTVTPVRFPDAAKSLSKPQSETSK